MSENNVPVESFDSDSANEHGKAEGKKVELWEFTCRTCNGKFAADVYEPKFCLYCGANLHFE